jgi:hypothetical protein
MPSTKRTSWASRSAAMLAAVPVGVSPTGANCPMGTVVITGNRKGDRPVESPVVKVSVGWGEWPRSDPPERRATRQAVAMRTVIAPKSQAHLKWMMGDLGVPNPLREDEGHRRWQRSWVRAANELPGVEEGGMLRRNAQRKHGTTCRADRRALPISRHATKLRCLGKWGGWGRLSDDGRGQHNPDPSEDPWGRAATAALTAVFEQTGRSDAVRRVRPGLDGYEGRRQTAALRGKALSEMPALKPYWGKPAVRNFRGDGGNIGGADMRHCSTRPASGLSAVHTKRWTRSRSGSRRRR